MAPKALRVGTRVEDASKRGRFGKIIRVLANGCGKQNGYMVHWNDLGADGIRASRTLLAAPQGAAAAAAPLPAPERVLEDDSGSDDVALEGRQPRAAAAAVEDFDWASDTEKPSTASEGDFEESDEEPPAAEGAAAPRAKVLLRCMLFRPLRLLLSM